MLRQALAIKPDDKASYTQLKALVAKRESIKLQTTHQRREKKWQNQFAKLKKSSLTIALEKSTPLLITTESLAVENPVISDKPSPEENSSISSRPAIATIEASNIWLNEFDRLLQNRQLINAANLLIFKLDNKNSSAAHLELINQKSAMLADLMYQKGQKVFRKSISEAIYFWELCLELANKHPKAKIKLLRAYKIRDNLNEID